MRQKIIAGNWKMHGSRESVQQLLSELKHALTQVQGSQIIVFPPAVFLEQTQNQLTDSSIAWGGQNLNPHQQGAYTGEIAASMLTAFGCKYVLIGHSERRTLYDETEQDTADKVSAAIQAGLIPVLCVGETLAQRKADETLAVISGQLDTVINSLADKRLFNQTIIAYEPVWAIGTGVTASPEQAQQVHFAIRQHLSKYDGIIGAKLAILYGGSVKAANAKTLFSMPDIDGGLIGGASLDAAQFIQICKEAV